MTSDRVVYSTEQGSICPDCGAPTNACACKRKQAGPPNDGVVRVSRETKGRKGKGVTLVHGLAEDPAALAQTAKRLKALCGSGGTVKDGVIEIQGDHRDRVVEHLKSLGLTVKKAGG